MQDNRKAQCESCGWIGTPDEFDPGALCPVCDCDEIAIQELEFIVRVPFCDCEEEY